MWRTCTWKGSKLVQSRASYLASIGHAQIALGLGNPHIEEMSWLKYVTCGVKRLAGGPTRSRLPITLSLLAELHHSWCVGRSDRDATMLWAAATMCFFGFLRAGEIVAYPGSGFDSSIHLSLWDVSVNSRSVPTYLAVSIKASKTDWFRQEVMIYLGRTHDWICPVAATLNYLVVRGASKGPLFIFGDGTHPYMRQFRLGSALGSVCCRSRYFKVRRSQLPYWGSHHGSKTRHPRLPY